jgi:hypothetical protein
LTTRNKRIALTQRDDDAADTITLHLGVNMVVGDATASFNQGAACEIAATPEQQVVIANADGDVVGEVSPAAGEFRQGEDGTWNCSYREDLEIEESSYYTFTVGGQYSEIVDRQTLQATGWTVTLEWLAP